MNPYLILGIVVALIVSHSGAYLAGHKNASNAFKAEQLEVQNKVIETANSLAVQDNALVAVETKEQENVKIVYRTIRVKVNENIAKNVSYADCGLDDIGLSFFNSYGGTSQDIAAKPVN